MRAGFPVHALVNMPHDDMLFVRLAHYLREGAWLGPYGNLTLAKGMFYPLFIALARYARIPLKIAEQIIYVTASAAAAGVVRRHAGSNRLALVLFALLAFNPVVWHVELARVLRDGLYMGLSLAVLALTVLIVFPGPGTSSSPGRILRRLGPGLGLGLLGAMFWLTREEGVWLIPALAVVIFLAVMRIWRRSSVPQSGDDVLPRRVDQLKAIVFPLALAVVGFVLAESLVATLNYRHYGVFETNEVGTASFQRAYGAITRIRQDEWRPYILFPEDARRRAYAASPAARELALSLEGFTGEGWRQASCSSMNVPVCTEVLAGWLMWELRDAVRDAGHYRTASEASQFYETLADQIDAACADGRLACLPRRATLRPPFRMQYLEETLRSGKAVAKTLFTLGGTAIGSAPSRGNPQGIAAISDLVGGVYPPNEIVEPIQVRIGSVIARGYAIAFPVLAFVGAAGLVLALFRRSDAHAGALLALASASAVAVCTRLALLAYLDATSFPAADVHYVAPASPFVIIVAVVGAYLGYTSILGTNAPVDASDAHKTLVGCE